MVANIFPDGRVQLANAGHLAPYLNGTELTVAGALPLGMVAEAAYESAMFHLSPGEQLTFVTDGVVEAQNAAGELFGFTRTEMISAQSSEAIAQAARRFGQSDDITALTVAMIGRTVAVAC